MTGLTATLSMCWANSLQQAASFPLHWLTIPLGFSMEHYNVPTY